MDACRYWKASAGATIQPSTSTGQELTIMAAAATVLGIVLILIAIPFGLMVAPLALGAIVAYLAWRHVAADWQTSTDGAPA
jgi:uncharacterized membrane protein AbrB (regulator of aidB expression)